MNLVYNERIKLLAVALNNATVATAAAAIIAQWPGFFTDQARSRAAGGHS